LLVARAAGQARADVPLASFILPAGGPRGKAVVVRGGGLFLHRSCGFEMLGPGIEFPRQLQRTRTFWLEGPLLPLPDSQQAEDYPKDMAGRVVIGADAPLGVRYWRVWTSQGATPALKFMVGDLPEVVEEEIDGDPVPVPVRLPVTINGRIFPRENVDVWTFTARKGQPVRCEVHAARLGSPLDAHLEVRGPEGRPLAEAVAAQGGDPVLRFTAPADGTYQARIHDIRMRGGQAYVYRLTISSEPHVESVYPLGGRRGQKTTFELTGQGLPAGPVEIALPAAGPAEYEHPFASGGKRTNGIHLDLDDLPEYREADAGKSLPVPAIFNGRIARPGAVAPWSWHARKGEVFELELRAARLGSPLDGILTVLDQSGKELARAEGQGPAQPDPVLRFQAPADATYIVSVRDRFASRGGPQFAYRLRIDRAGRADYSLRLAADAVTVARGGQARLKILAERRGSFGGPIRLTVDGLPAGVTASPLAIAAGQVAVDLNFKGEKDAVITAVRLTVHGTATVDAKEVRRKAELSVARGLPPLDTVLMAVALPTPFKIKGAYQMRWVARGTTYDRRYQIDRGGFVGPIVVSLADRQARHLQGVTGPTIVVPAGATEFTFPVQLPPWMETGRTSRVCVMGVGIIKDKDGREHEVSFSSTNVSEQLVAVVEPGPLDIEAERSSVSVAPGKTITLAVRVTHGKSLKGEARVELVVPAHVRGVSAEPVVVPAGQERAALTVRFASGALGPFNMPLTLRATLNAGGGPVVAETKVEFLPES
jgi:hypothetical protein